MIRTMQSGVRIRLYSVLSLAVFLLSMTASAPAASLPTHHVRQAVINGQAKFMNPLPADQSLPIGILLPVRDQAGLKKFLQDVYDPASPSYQRFLTVPEFTARFAPTQEDYDAVVYFVESKGMTVTNLSANRLLINVTASVASIENAFHVTMGVYQHPTENRTFFAPDREPTVDLYVPLWHIAGLDNYSIPRPAGLTQKSGEEVVIINAGSGPGGGYLPSDMRAAYYGTGSLTGSGQAVGIFSANGYLQSDVTLYYQTYNMSSSVPVNNVLVNGYNGACNPGPNNSVCDDAEQVLDIVNAIGMAPALSQIFFYEDNGAGFDANIFDQMATDNAAKQLSCSWTWQPADPRSDDQFLQEFAAQGQNLFVASGDSGSYPNSSGYYYPAEDGNVVAVGGTDLTTSGPGGTWVSETAWSNSGGGISPDGIQIPSWQQLAGVINSSNGGSTIYRNVPDVAAEANWDNFTCVNGACSGGWGGTSFAAPRWAGYLALANQQEYANYDATFGFLNQLIYPIGVGSGYSAAFYDITSGSNGTYSAVPGYDLVTGWGSPNGAGLIDALTGTAPQQPTASVSPTNLNLISKYDGQASGTVTVTNNGPSPLVLVISSTRVTNSFFYISGGTCTPNAQIPYQGSCGVQVTFDPGGCLTEQTGELEIYDNTAAGGQSANLTGKTSACTTKPKG